jgi:hypothetical protein
MDRRIDAGLIEAPSPPAMHVISEPHSLLGHERGDMLNHNACAPIVDDESRWCLLNRVNSVWAFAQVPSTPPLLVPATGRARPDKNGATEPDSLRRFDTPRPDPSSATTPSLPVMLLLWLVYQALGGFGGPDTQTVCFRCGRRAFRSAGRKLA